MTRHDRRLRALKHADELRQPVKERDDEVTVPPRTPRPKRLPEPEWPDLTVWDEV